MRLPLEGLYLRLIREGFPLSARDYADALAALRFGYGTLTRADLEWLCGTLWAHTEEEKIRLTKLFRDLPPPTLEAIRRMTGASEHLSEPALNEKVKEAEAVTRGEQRGAPAPSVEFAAAGELGGVGLPRAAAPSSLLQPHILTPRPAVSFRQLVVAWRRFRLARRSGPKVVLDIDATIAEKCRTGTLSDLAMTPERRNEARMLALFDASPSMAPWRATAPAVADSLARSQLGHAEMYYFDNDPGGDLFDSDLLTRPRSLDDAAREHPGCALIVIGDAGAARGRLDQQRVRSARRFADLARDRSWWPIAWLNPMPRKRWAGCSAARIAGIPGIVMFELTEDGLVAAVDHLRGKGGR